MIEGEADYRDLMRQLVVQEYDELREASRTLRLEARELCRYAATVRSRASLLGAQHGRPGRSLRR